MPPKTKVAPQPKAQKKAAEHKAPKKAAEPKAPKPSKKAVEPKPKAPKAPKKAVEPKADAKVVRRTVPSTVDGFQELAAEAVATLDALIERVREEKGKGLKELKSVRKNVLLLSARVPKLAKQKTKRATNNTQSGLKKEVPISDELAKFLKLPKGSSLSRIDAGRAISVYCHLDPNETREEHLKWASLNEGGERNLQSQSGSKSNLVPDAALSKLLKYDQYVKDVNAGKITCNRAVKDEDGKTVKDDNNRTKKEVVVQTDPTLTYATISKLIQRHFVKE